MNNCVGFKNYRYFYLFLLWIWIGTIYFLLVVFNEFYFSLFKPRKSAFKFGTRQYISLSYVISCSVLIAISFLGGFHTYLLATNQSTIEFQINFAERYSAKARGEVWKNPYDMGYLENVRQVLGPNILLGLFPWAQPRGWLDKGTGLDGLSWPKHNRWRLDNI